MARSRRHTKIFGISATSSSEKRDKRKANRALRVAVRSAVARDDDVLPGLRQVSNIATFVKDGKSWYAGATVKDMRK